MNMIRSGPIPRKQQTKRLEELAAACTAKIRDEVLPALRVRAESALGGERWEIVIDRILAHLQTVEIGPAPAAQPLMVDDVEAKA